MVDSHKVVRFGTGTKSRAGRTPLMGGGYEVTQVNSTFNPFCLFFCPSVVQLLPSAATFMILKLYPSAGIF